MATELQKVEPHPLVTAPTDVLSLLERAIDKGIDVDSLEKLVALHERLQDREAAKAFVVALAEFQNECPPIPREKPVEFVSDRGGKVRYNYATFEVVAETVRPLLYKHGLAMSFPREVVDGVEYVVFLLQHRDGHSTRTLYPAPPGGTGLMSPAQKTAGGNTTAKRHAMINGLALATCDPDDDDIASPEDLELINEEAVRDLNDLIIETDADRKKFLAFMGVTKLSEIQGGQFARGFDSLMRKKAGMGK